MTIEVNLDTRKSADVRVQAPTTSGDLGGDLVESPLCLIAVEGASRVGRLGARPFPDRERYLARQAMPRAFVHRVERMAHSLSLELNPPRAVGAKACLAKELQINGKDWPVAPGGGGAPGAAKGKQ